MTCDLLAYTGPGAHLGCLLVFAIAFLVVGTLVLLMTRPRGRAVTVALLLLVSGAAVSIPAGTPALAYECPPAPNSLPITADNSLTITQTSVMEDLAPGIVPVPITGVVRNNSTDSTDIIAIDVKIVKVVTAPGSVPGKCDRSDYVLLNPMMPVGRTLQPGGSTAFHGASIGFSTKSTNQDACKGATLELLYTANPT